MKVTLDTENAAYWLREIQPKWKGFWLHMHLVAFSLPEFADALTQITDEVFAYHVSGQKNDFAKWVNEVVGDSELARTLGGVTTKEEAAEAVRERVAVLRRVASAGRAS